MTLNPFGDEKSTYFVDPWDDYDKDTKEVESPYKRWVINILVLLVVTIGVLFVSNGVYVSNMRSSAESSIQQMNREMLDIQSLVSQDIVLSQYQGLVESETDPNKKTLREVVVGTSQTIKTTPLEPITPSTDSESTAIVLAPYFALCDSVTLLEEAGDISIACSDLTISAYDMMNKVDSFNHIATSINGKVAWANTAPLPDVTT